MIPHALAEQESEKKYKVKSFKQKYHKNSVLERFVSKRKYLLVTEWNSYTYILSSLGNTNLNLTKHSTYFKLNRSENENGGGIAVGVSNYFTARDISLKTKYSKT